MLFRSVERMRNDAKQLHAKGNFRADGLTNTALGKASQQGFTQAADRQTFRGNDGSWYNEELGDYKTRIEFDALMNRLRTQLAKDLNRPTLLASSDESSSLTSSSDGDDERQLRQQQRHEVTYNWYEPGARLGRHLNEHHEEKIGRAHV